MRKGDTDKWRLAEGVDLSAKVKGVVRITDEDGKPVDIPLHDLNTMTIVVNGIETPLRGF